MQLIEHLEKNEVITLNHHGSLGNKSMHTAQAAIYLALQKETKKIEHAYCYVRTSGCFWIPMTVDY